MTAPKYAMRRDNNESALVETAEKLGWWLRKSNEDGDFWGFRAGHWWPIEIKNPDCEGHADEFTAKQKIFHSEAKNRSARILIWRRDADVIRDSQRAAFAGEGGRGNAASI